MHQLTEEEKRELTELIEAGEPIPEKWQYRLFPTSGLGQATGKEYRLVYEGAQSNLKCNKIENWYW